MAHHRRRDRIDVLGPFAESSDYSIVTSVAFDLSVHHVQWKNIDLHLTTQGLLARVVEQRMMLHFATFTFPDGFEPSSSRIPNNWRYEGNSVVARFRTAAELAAHDIAPGVAQVLVCASEGGQSTRLYLFADMTRTATKPPMPSLPAGASDEALLLVDPTRRWAKSSLSPRRRSRCCPALRIVRGRS